MKNPYISNSAIISPARIEKLKRAITTHGSLVIGLDYDNTVRGYKSKEAYTDIVDIAKLAIEKGHVLCIWTANAEEEDVKKDLTSLGINFHHYNTSPLFNDRRKPHFNILLDDIAGLNESYHTLMEILKD